MLLILQEKKEMARNAIAENIPLPLLCASQHKK